MNERIDQLRQRLREDSSSRLFFQLGELLRREGESAEAVEVLRSGLETFPRYVAAWVSLGRTLFEISSFEDAEQAFEKALELDPENPNAARMLGETAMGREDWLEAIKKLKRARVFSPRDENLEELIGIVEKNLAENGQLEGEATADTPSMEAVAAVEPPVGDDQEFEPEQDEGSTAPDDDLGPFADPDVPATDEVPISLADGDVDDEEELDFSPEEEIEPVPAPPALESTGEDDTDEPDRVVEPDTVEDESAGDPFAVPVEQAEPPAEVFSLSDDDPFSSSPRGDTGVFTPGNDVFGETPAEEPAEHETEEDRHDAEPQEPEISVSAAIEETQVDAVEATPADPEGAEVVEPLPLPTVTLARLALEQGEKELAERTLRGVLELDPGNTDAAALCSEIGLVVDETQPPRLGASLPEAKIAALQGWLQTVKLGAEG